MFNKCWCSWSENSVKKGLRKNLRKIGFLEMQVLKASILDFLNIKIIGSHVCGHYDSTKSHMDLVN